MAEYESLVGPPRYKSHRKYGSVSTYMKREKIIKHTVKSDDTLQGIALKYGTSMEIIKRQNHLWTNDSLFLKPYLEIPVPQDCNLENCDDTTNANSSSDNPVETKETDDKDSDLEEEASDRSEISFAEFLNRLDSNITANKSNVKKLEKKSSFASNSLESSSEIKPSTCRISNKKRHEGGTANEHTLSDIPLTCVKMPQSLKFRSSQEKLQKKQDELFEL